MQTKLIDQEIEYDGSQLRSHWIYENFNLLGPAAVAFSGKCQVSLEQMVDLEDVKEEAPIYSPHMLHFIVELFDCDLKTTIALQRLMISLIAEELNSRLTQKYIQRRGDDLYYQDAKLSVSIATSSPVSTLIHTGLNIKIENTPVKTIGLEQLIAESQIKSFAQKILQCFHKEYRSIHQASYKVRSTL